jgi:hypothetical protein
VSFYGPPLALAEVTAVLNTTRFASPRIADRELPLRHNNSLQSKMIKYDFFHIFNVPSHRRLGAFRIVPLDRS